MLSGPMCILLQGTVTMEKFSPRCCWGSEFDFLWFIGLNEANNDSVVGTNFQDCAGVILCAAERATQVALQVEKLYSDCSISLHFNKLSLLHVYKLIFFIYNALFICCRPYNV